MERKRLIESLLVAVSFATSPAGAVALNPDGIGQVLLYPYYTINVGNQTLLSVVNTQNAGKAVKVRFREAFEGRSVLDFNLFLSPYDVWVATVFDTANINGRADDMSVGAGLLTPDNSCTDPAIKHGTAGLTEILPDGRNFIAFSNRAFTLTNADGGPGELSRTRTGHIELIEMADITGETLKSITHVNGVPLSCASVVGTSAETDYLPPAGGLFGSVSIVNVANGTLYAVNAEALSGFYSNSGNLFTPAGATLPDLGSGDNGNISAGNAVSYVFDQDGTPITSSWPLANGGSFDAVSSLFTAAIVFNEFEVNQTTGAVASEWVVTLPTKYHYADPASTAPVAPFTAVFGADTANPATACEKIDFTLYDRDERTPHQFDSGFDGPSFLYPSLCWEASVTTFQSIESVETMSPIFGAPLFAGVDTIRALGIAYGTSGTKQMFLAGYGHALHPSIEGNTFAGLPVIGFLAKDFTNQNVTPGVLGNYAGTYRHHLIRACTRATGDCH